MYINIIIELLTIIVSVSRYLHLTNDSYVAIVNHRNGLVATMTRDQCFATIGHSQHSYIPSESEDSSLYITWHSRCYKSNYNFYRSSIMCLCRVLFYFCATVYICVCSNFHGYYNYTYTGQVYAKQTHLGHKKCKLKPIRSNIASR